MTREELEAHVFAQLLAAMGDGKAMGRQDAKQAQRRVQLIMAYVDAHVSAQAGSDHG